MDSIDASLLSEDQQYEMAEAAMVAYGLESVSPAALVEDGFSETIQYGRYEVLDYQEAKDGKPSSVLCEITYSAPCYGVDGVTENIDLYKRQFRVFMSSAQNGAQALRDNPQAWPGDTEGNPLVPLEDGARFMEPWAESCGLPQDGQFYADVYAQPGLTAIGKMPKLVGEPWVLTGEWMNLMQYTGVWQEIIDSSCHHGITQISHMSGHGFDISGRSGVQTFFGKGRAKGKTADDRLRVVEGNIVVTMTDNPDCEPLLLHSAEWQKKLGQDAPEDKRIPTPEIRQNPRRYYGEEMFFVQEYAYGGHFWMVDTAELGKALGRIHNYPADEAEPPPVTSALDEGKLITSAKAGLKDAAERTREGKVHGTEERMKSSIRGRLLERFTFEEIQQREPDLCRQVGLTRAAAERHKLMRRRKAEEDAALPQGLCHGDLHAKNVLSDISGKKIQLLDFQLTGKGVFVDELVLALYFFCAGDDGKLDSEKTRAFFREYCKERCLDDKKTGNIPLTRQELQAIPARLSALAQRQTHPVWEMFGGGISVHSGYETFAERNHALPEQMENILQHGGIERFAREFAGLGLDALPDYTPVSATAGKHVSRLGEKKGCIAGERENDGDFIGRIDRNTKESGSSLMGSGV